jgi:hypothetical protein
LYFAAIFRALSAAFAMFAPSSFTYFVEVNRFVALDLKATTIRAIAVDSRERFVAISQYDHPREGVALVDLSSGSIAWRAWWEFSTSDMVHSVAFTRDGERLWVALSSASLRCYAAADGVLFRETPSSSDVESAKLSRDARYAVIRGSVDRTPGWFAFAATIETFEVVEPADEALPASADRKAMIEAVARTCAEPSVTVLRFGGKAPIAHSPDGALEVVCEYDERSGRSRFIVRSRSTATDLDVVELPSYEGALCATFTDDSARFYVGTSKGRVLGFSV